MKTYELLKRGTGEPSFAVVTTERPIKGLQDAVKYCREKKLMGSFIVKAVVGGFKNEEETKLKTTVL